jgi:arylsulfatase
VLSAARVALVVAALVGCGTEGRLARPNIVLITLDTTRADRLGCYGFRGNTTPHLDLFAAKAVVHTRAQSTTSWTLPAHASLFTGKFTSSHGARYDVEGPLRLSSAIDGPPGWDRLRARGLSPQERTLAQVLAEAGYATGAVVAGPWMKRVMGLAAGFGHYDDEGIHSLGGRPASEVTARALAWIRKGSDRPFFLFLNYFDPHFPYMPPPGFARELQPLELGADPTEHIWRRSAALYEGEIRFMDHHLGRLFEGLRELGLFDASWFIVTADHGELLGEHVLGEHVLGSHGRTLYQEELHIPLIVKYPKGEVLPGRSEEYVQLVDVLPTILTRLDLPLPPDIQGTPLSHSGHPIVAEVYPMGFVEHAQGDFRALFDGDYKFVWRSNDQHQLFDLARDPGESRNLRWEMAERSESMNRALSDYLASLPPPGAAGPPQEIDQETAEALRGLGYLE